MKNRVGEKGFGAVEAVLVVVVIALIGVIGYLVYTRQTGTPINNSQPSSITTDQQASTKASDVYDALAKLGDKINSLASGKYKIEKLEGAATSIKTGAATTLAIEKGNSLNYRADMLSVGTGVTVSQAEADQYHADINADADAYNLYAADDLGLEKVYSYEDSGPSGVVFKNSVYKIGDYYLCIETSEYGGAVVSWGK